MKSYKTKFNESKVVITRDDVLNGTKDAEFKNHPFLATNLTRSYLENLVNAETGEVVPVRKYETISHRGDAIDDDVFAKIRFHAQCQELDDFSISDQCRAGVAFKSDNMTVWKVSIDVVVNNKLKKQTFLLYACSMEQAVEIVTDFAEQNFDGAFRFNCVKSYHNCRIINNKFIKDSENTDDDIPFDSMFYILDCVIEDVGDKGKNMIGAYSFLTRAANAERAKEIVHTYIATKSDEEFTGNTDKDDIDSLPFTVNPETMRITIMSANIVKCTHVIHPDFSMIFINQSNADTKE